MFGTSKSGVAGKIGRISLRERIFLGIGSIVGISVVIYFFMITPLLERTKVLDRLLIQKDKEVDEINLLKNNYLQIKSKISSIDEKLARQKEGFSLLSFLEGIATKDEIRKNIIYMRPQNLSTMENYRILSVEVKLDELRMGQIIEFISSIENSPYLLRVKRIHMKTRYSDPKFLDTTIVISTFEKI